MAKKSILQNMVLDYLNEHGSITRSEAADVLGMPKKQFWDAICHLRKRGVYIRIQRNISDTTQTVYALGTEADRMADEMRPKYKYSTDRRLWGVWTNMRSRCRDDYHKSYASYGGRGIKVCDEWANDFQAFAEWAYANGYDKDASYMKCTLDRIDPEGNYEPSNCRWADMKTQCRNRRNNTTLTYKGETKCVAEWSEERHIPFDTITRRLKLGWSVEDALTKPVKKQKNNRVV